MLYDDIHQAYLLQYFDLSKKVIQHIYTDYFLLQQKIFVITKYQIVIIPNKYKIFQMKSIDLKENNIQKIVVIFLMDQDEIFVIYEIMTFEKVYQDTDNQLIHDKTFELYND